jgi:hypothetical protein
MSFYDICINHKLKKEMNPQSPTGLNMQQIKICTAHDKMEILYIHHYSSQDYLNYLEEECQRRIIRQKYKEEIQHFKTLINQYQSKEQQ